jgi:peptidoglycan/LPS O-acetylase OafA/YrhL
MAATSPEVPPGVHLTKDRSAQIAVLTGLRGFAALMVVLIHTSGRTDFPWLGIKSYGPISLFVLSGFLLYRPWARWSLRTGQRPSVHSFAVRRLSRIFPAYLVVLLVVTVVYPPSIPSGADGWVRALTLTGIYASDGLPEGLEQTWSLGTELSWYVALPVMGLTAAVAVRGRPPRQAFWLTLGMISLSLPVSAAWRWWVDVNDLGIHFTYSFWLPGFLFCFGCGAVVALLLEGYKEGLVSLPRLRAMAGHRGAIPAVALVAVGIGASSLAGPDLYLPATFSERQVRTVCAVVLAVALLVGAVFGDQRSVMNRLLSTRPAVAVGRWSYGIYLWHLPVIAVLYTDFVFPRGVPGLLLPLATVVVISLALSAATYAWVEQPAIAWSHRMTPTRRRRREESSQVQPTQLDPSEPTPGTVTLARRQGSTQ